MCKNGLKRDEYTYKNHEKYSLQNEPRSGYVDMINYTEYPDMKRAYDKIEKLIGTKNFIITSGCEMAYRIALQALHRDSIFVEYPTWGLAQFYAQAFGMDVELLNYKYDNDSKLFYISNQPESGALIYHTDRYSNFFKHKDLELKSENFYITDATYTLDISPIKHNEVRIMSLSKIAGAGLRLGIAMFPDFLYDKFHMFREQYVNSGAFSYIMSLNEFPKYKDMPIEKEQQACHEVYKTYFTEPELPYKKIIVDKIELYRTGNPRCSL